MIIVVALCWGPAVVMARRAATPSHSLVHSQNKVQGCLSVHVTILFWLVFFNFHPSSTLMPLLQ